MYKIVRFYYPGKDGYSKPSRTIKSRLTLDEAQKHCSDPKTRKEGVYFDGYMET